MQSMKIDKIAGFMGASPESTSTKSMFIPAEPFYQYMINKMCDMEKKSSASIGESWEMKNNGTQCHQIPSWRLFESLAEVHLILWLWFGYVHVEE